MSSANRPSFYIDSYITELAQGVTTSNSDPKAQQQLSQLTPKHKAILYGASWLVQTYNVEQASGIIAVDQLQVLTNCKDILEPLVGGSKNFQRLMDGDTVMLGTTPVRAMTLKKIPAHIDGVVLAIFPSEKLLSALDAQPGITGVLVVPWQQLNADKPVSDWISRWSAQPIVPIVNPPKP